jgi:hypothetical protein
MGQTGAVRGSFSTVNASARSLPQADVPEVRNQSVVDPRGAATGGTVDIIVIVDPTY